MGAGTVALPTARGAREALMGLSVSPSGLSQFRNFDERPAIYSTRKAGLPKHRIAVEALFAAETHFALLGNYHV